MNWIKYLLEANLYLVLFYAGYYLLLRCETHYQLNRLYLLSCSVLAFVTPLLQLGFLKPAPVLINQITTPMMPVIITHSQPVNLVPIMNPAPIIVTEPTNYYVLIYTAVAMIMAIGLMLRIYQLTKLARKGKHIVANRVNLIELEDDEHAFSFFSYLFISKKLTSSATIIQHELVHIRQRHSLDIMYLELVKIICWFNPIVYLMQNSVKELHEFIADNKIAGAQQDVNHYTDFLINNAYGLPEMAITNNFFTKNLLKKRIMMLHQKRSGNAARLKYLVALPLLAGMLCLSTLGFTKDYPVYVLAPKTPVKEKAIHSVKAHQPKTLQAIVNEALKPAITEATAGIPKPENTPAKVDSMFGKYAPLYVIDGVILTKRNAAKYGMKSLADGPSPLQFIPQKDIVSMEILKDGSGVSLYGPKAYYGVILVTTKNNKQKAPAVAPPPSSYVIDPNNFTYQSLADIADAFDKQGYNFSYAKKKDENGLPLLEVTLRGGGPNGTKSAMAGFRLNELKDLNRVILVGFTPQYNFVRSELRSAVSASTVSVNQKGTIDLEKLGFTMPPLYIVDGITVTPENAAANGFDNLGPNNSLRAIMPMDDVNSLEVLKQKAGLSLYGDMGANGVIIIKTVQAQAKKAEAAKADTVDKAMLNDFYRYVVGHVRYPAIAREKGVQGKVFIIFNVNDDNRITNLKVLRGLSTETDTEVIRVLKEWAAPANFPKNLNFTVPISFSLTDLNSGFMAAVAPAESSTYIAEPYVHNDFKSYALKETVVRGYVKTSK